MEFFILGFCFFSSHYIYWLMYAFICYLSIFHFELEACLHIFLHITESYKNLGFITLRFIFENNVLVNKIVCVMYLDECQTAVYLIFTLNFGLQLKFQYCSMELRWKCYVERYIEQSKIWGTDFIRFP